MKSKEDGMKIRVLALCTADFRMDGRSYFHDFVNTPSNTIIECDEPGS